MEERNRKKIKWSDEMNENLVDCISNYRLNFFFNNIAFDANKSVQYKKIYKSVFTFSGIDVNKLLQNRSIKLLNQLK